MKRRITCALFALSFGFAAGCAEQPGKKKEEEVKSEVKAIDGSKPAAKPADAKPADAKPADAAPAPEAK
jgi:hypothetical protein